MGISWASSETTQRTAPSAIEKLVTPRRGTNDIQAIAVGSKSQAILTEAKTSAALAEAKVQKTNWPPASSERVPSLEA